MAEENTPVGWEFPPDEDSPPEESYQTMTAFETWIKAISSPNIATYKAIVNDPGASLGKAVLWLLLASLISGILSGLSTLFAGDSPWQQFAEYGVDMPSATSATLIFGIMCFSAVLGVIGAFIAVGIYQLAARALGGAGTFDQLFYGYAAIQVPTSVILGILTLIPTAGTCLAIIPAIYTIVLLVLAIQAAHELDSGKAVLAALAPVLLALLACVCVFVVVISLGLGSSGVTDVFNQIAETLSY